MKDGYPEAMILAGGKGTRLRTIVQDRPKPLAMVGGKPFLEWILLALRLQGVRRVVICTGYLGDMVEEFFCNAKSTGLELACVREPFALGTAGAVRNAIGEIKTRDMLVQNGDSYVRFDLSAFLKGHRALNAKATLGLVRVKDISRYGFVRIDAKGQVVAFCEKEKNRASGLINAGVYLLDRDFAKEIPAGKSMSLEKEFFPDLVGKGLYGAVFDGPFVDIGTPKSFANAGKIMEGEFKYLSE
jgi:D-glycero-alpha-D-manno-heptose 1-phosphate guanylyltransferase